MVFSVYDIALFEHAVLHTAILSLAGGLLGVAGGIALTAMRLSTVRWLPGLGLVGAAYVQIMRRIPFIVTLYGLFFLAGALGADIGAMGVAIGAIGLIASAYLSEIILGGIRTVGPEQFDSALALDLPVWARWRHVVLPQAMRAILPPAIGYLVLFIKDTALASQIGVVELSQAGVILSSRGLPATPVFIVVLSLYFALSYPLTRLSRALEKRLALS